jgi:hypothetical protein
MRIFITLFFISFPYFFHLFSFFLPFYISLIQIHAFIYNTCIYPHINLQKTYINLRLHPTFPLPNTTVRSISWRPIVTKTVYKFFVNYVIRNLSTTYRRTSHCNVSVRNHLDPIHFIYSYFPSTYTSPKIVFSLQDFHLKFCMNFILPCYMYCPFNLVLLNQITLVIRNVE